MFKTLCHRKVTTLWKWPKSKSARFTYGWNPPPQVTNGPYWVWSWVGPLGPGGPIWILGGPKAHFFHFLNRLLHTQYLQQHKNLKIHYVALIQAYLMGQKKFDFFGPFWVLLGLSDFPKSAKNTPRVRKKSKQVGFPTQARAVFYFLW